MSVSLEAIGVTSMFRLIHRSEGLVRMCPTFDLRCEENAARWKLKLDGRN